MFYLSAAILSLLGIIYADTQIPIHLSHDDDASAPEEEVRLQDFFWTGSGDGPPEYIKKVHTGINKGKDVIVKTETIVATVYVDKENDVDKICLDCSNDPTYLSINYTTTDRRYWLLTVVSGFFRQRDLPLLEEKLAKLYRIAFTRQQSRHLGIYNGSARSKNSFRKRRQRKQQSNNITGEYDDDPKLIQTTIFDDEEENGVWLNESSTAFPFNVSKTVNKLENLIQNSSYNGENHGITLVTVPEKNHDTISSGQYSYQKQDDQVRVLVHNITLITEEDIQGWDEGKYNAENKQKRISRPFANQTELIYSVFYNGKPVLATTAAEDMKLVPENEVELIMEKNIFMKAEPYLKEPQATPLVPANKNDKAGFLTIFNRNTTLIAISSVAIVLLLLLLVVLLLMTKAKRERSAEVKRLSSRQELLIEHSFDTSRRVKDAAVEVSRLDLEDGIQNMGYDRDMTIRKQTPAISFPLPPRSRPGSSGTSTSDSSVYCPVNRPNADLQSMLDDKAAKLFEKRRKVSRARFDEKSDALYTTVGREKKTKLKQKRRYLSENRVGSIEEPKALSSDTFGSNDSSSDGYKQNYDDFDRNGVQNLNHNYHRNKILQNRVFTDKIYDTVNEGIATPTQAINREIIKALQGEKSSESGSIGSYLSMASVKSFPRNVLPEPLHRVLEPVSVTYYDNYDDATFKTFKRPKLNKHVTLEEFKPTTQVTVHATSHSDNPDPGVVGPVVWEIHKKNRNQYRIENKESPIHNPAACRNRYEGLLEGAIQMYANPDEVTNLPSSNNSSISRLRENRGRSAIVASDPNRLSRSNSDARPMTAGLEKCQSNHSTQPPSPNDRAWGSGAPSPLIRPLSAGPFHRPQPPAVDVTRVLVSQSTEKSELSAAPLIEAIQNELRKFKRECSQ